MYPGFGREMAKARIDYLHAEAEADRLTSGIRAAGAARRRARVRAFLSSMLSILRVPFRSRPGPAVSVPELPAAAVDPVEVVTSEITVRVAPPIVDTELPAPVEAERTALPD